MVSTFTLAVASWLAAGSVERALVEADRTKQLEKAYQLIAEQKNRLEEGIGIIQTVHSRVANGDLQARASITSGELLPLAVGLNLMLDRLARSLAAEDRLGDFEQSMNRLNEAAFAFGQGQIRKAIPVREAGRLEPLAISLEQLRQRLVETFNRGGTLAREITTLSSALLAALQQQDAYLQAVHHERYQLRSARTHIQNVREEIKTQYNLFDHMVRIQQNSGTVTLRPVDTLSLLRVLKAKAKELDDSETLLEGVESQITQLVTLTGAYNGHEERQDQRKAIERRLYSATEQLEQLLVRFAV
jgi:D-ribose pyranose/furanose isomerase RbsD